MGGDVTLPAAACLLASARLMLESAQMSVRAARRRMSSGESGASSPGGGGTPPASASASASSAESSSPELDSDAEAPCRDPSSSPPSSFLPVAPGLPRCSSLAPSGEPLAVLCSWPFAASRRSI